MKRLFICFVPVSIIACGSGGSSGSGGNSSQQCNPCTIYSANNHGQGYNGNIKAQANTLLNSTFNNGITAADAICNFDESKPALPSSAKYKALLADGINRGWNPNINWVIYPNTVYVNTNGSVIATSSESAIFGFPTESNLVMNIQFAWTGLGSSSSDWQASASNCNSWSSNESSTWGNSGYEDYSQLAYARSFYQIYQGNTKCNLNQSTNLPIGIICIQQ